MCPHYTIPMLDDVSNLVQGQQGLKVLQAAALSWPGSSIHHVSALCQPHAQGNFSRLVLHCFTTSPSSASIAAALEADVML